MIRLREPQLKLWDTVVAQPEFFRLPERLQTIDRYLDDDRFLAPFLKRGQQRVGRPTVPMECYLRLMFLKHERRLGYETLVTEVADSLTLRRFVRLDISDPIPHPTTLSRLTQRFGEETVVELHSSLVAKFQEDGLVKGQRLRTDTTVIKADVEHPTDAGLLADGVNLMSRTVKKLTEVGARVGVKLADGYRDSTRTMKKTLWEIGRFLKKRITAAGVDQEQPGAEAGERASTEEKKAALFQKVNSLTAKAYEVAKTAIRQARAVARSAKRRVANKPSQSRQRVARLCAQLLTWLSLTQKAVDQTALRLAGQTSIPNRMVSIFDPEARPIRRGKLSAPTEFGYKLELTQVEGKVISDYQVHIGNPGDKTLLVGVAERHIQQFGRAPEEVATDRGYHSAANEKALTAMGVEHVSSPACGKLSEARAKHQEEAWFKRLQRWRAGSEGSISYFQRKFGGDRSRLRGRGGASIWAGWGVVSHNLNKVAGLLAARADRSEQAAANARRAHEWRSRRIW